MDQLILLKQEIATLKERNARVEADKAWETSYARKCSIAVMTYVIVAAFFLVADFPRPFVGALVPVAGFLLSTLSISLLKKLWIRFVYRG